jgi:hypothetical protein
MNRRKLKCGKEVIAVGQDESISDYKNKLLTCFNCYKFITCKYSQEYLQGIIIQQDNIVKLSYSI